MYLNSSIDRKLSSFSPPNLVSYTNIIAILTQHLSRCIDIFPKSAKSLSIPIHKAAYGKSPRQLEGTFTVHKRDGSAFIAQNQGGSLAFLYVLKQHVHQRMDKTMMPSDDSLAEAALSRALQTLQDVPSGDTK